MKTNKRILTSESAELTINLTDSRESLLGKPRRFRIHFLCFSWEETDCQRAKNRRFFCFHNPMFRRKDLHNYW